MLEKRVIPCLLLHKGGLYKTEKFKKPTYIGDPINAIKIFNEKEVDELEEKIKFYSRYLFFFRHFICQNKFKVFIIKYLICIC